jgi:hypothetical protein
VKFKNDGKEGSKNVIGQMTLNAGYVFTIINEAATTVQIRLELKLL